MLRIIGLKNSTKMHTHTHIHTTPQTHTWSHALSKSEGDVTSGVAQYLVSLYYATLADKSSEIKYQNV